MTAEPSQTDETKRRRPSSRTVIVVVASVLALGAVAAGVGVLAGGSDGGDTASPTKATSSNPGVSTSSPSPRAIQSSDDPSADPSGGTSGGTDDAPASAEPTTGPHKTLPPVPLAATAAPSTGIDAEVTSLRAIRSSATLPGDVAGPALEVTVKLTNDQDRPLDLTQTVVNLYYGADRTPGEANQTGAKPFPQTVPAGESASGVFVFRVPSADRKKVVVEVDLGVAHSVVLFRGPAPR